MANISSYLQQILDARYGEEVRGSIHDAISAINTQVEESDPVNLETSSLVLRRTLNSNDDLDTLQPLGLYFWTNANIPKNAPESNAISFRMLFIKGQGTADVTNTTKVQLVFDSNNHFYYRVHVAANLGAWNNWKEIASLEDILYVNTYGGTANNIKNLNDLENNKVYSYTTSGNNLVNAPEDDPNWRGTVICLSYGKTAYSDAGKIQIAIGYPVTNPKMFYRLCWNATFDWSPWINVKNGIAAGIMYDQTNADKYFPSRDFNDLLINKVSTIADNRVGELLNAPYLFYTGTILALSSRDESSVGEVQLGFNSTGEVFSRINFGGVGNEYWKPWYTISSPYEITDNLLQVFTKMGFIGDSLSSGEVFYNEGGSSVGVDIYEKSWGHFLCHTTGAEENFFCAGGISANQWFNHESSKFNNKTIYQTFLESDPCDIYFLCLFENDYRGWHLPTWDIRQDNPDYAKSHLGTVADIGKDTSVTDTFYAYYSRVISEIKKKSPKAPIFCFIPPSSFSSDTLRNENFNNYALAVETIVGYMGDNAHLIDLREYANIWTSSSGAMYRNRTNGHFNVVGYKTFADIVNRLCSEYMRKNYSKFLQVEWILSEHSRT